MDGGWTGFVCSTACNSVSDCVSGWSCSPVVGLNNNLCTCTYSPEVCDGKDNNCNGIVDEEPAADQVCVAESGVGQVCIDGGCACSPSLCAAESDGGEMCRANLCVQANGLAIIPNPIGFSNVPAGQTLSRSASVTNVGLNTVAIDCVYLKSLGQSSCGASTSIFGFTGSSAPAQVAPQSSFALTITYTASGNPNGDTDQLDIDFTPTGASLQTATDPILGNQSLSSCSLKITPSSLNFGTVTIGAPVIKSTTLSNIGQSFCHVTGIALGATSDPSYSLDASQATSLTIPASGSATITVDFNLDNSGNPTQRSGAVDYQSDDPNHATGQIPLTATP